MRTPDSSAGVRPSSASAAVMRRQEIPASTSRHTPSRSTSAALPEEPLAMVCKMVKEKPPCVQIRGRAAKEKAASVMAAGAAGASIADASLFSL